MEAILNFALSVFHFVEEHIWADWLTPIVVFITNLGDGAFWIIFSLLMLIPKKTRKAGVVMLVAMALMGIGNNLIIKNLVARPRPYNLLDWEGISKYPALAAKWAEQYHFPGYVDKLTSYSFPSGHTSSSFAPALALMLTLDKKDKPWAIPAIILALLIGFTRIYVHVHYCTDVLGGLVSGAIWAVAAYFIVKAVYPKVTAAIAKRKEAKAK